MTKFPIAMCLAGCLSIVGCATQPEPVQQSAAALPQQWSFASSSPTDTVEPWWKYFNDGQLDDLIDQAIRKNNDLAAASIRARLAQLQASLVATNMTPSVTVSADSGVRKSFNPVLTSRSSNGLASLDMEIDLWGKLASQRNAASFQAQASQEDCQSIAATLTVTTARLYWQVAYLNQLVALSSADIDYATRTLDIVKSKYAAGAISGLGVAQAELNLSSLQAAHTQLVQQRVAARHAMSILFDQPPESALNERTTLPDTPLPPIAAGLPAEILGNRADLRAAELRLRETLANVDATRASFYPALRLTSGVGTASTALFDFLKNPVATLGAGLVLPFVQWNTRQLSIRVSEAQHEEAVVNFRQRLYVALSEVEDGLSARTQFLLEGDKLGMSVTQAQRAESIAQSRYLAGVTEVQPWLDSQAALRSAERSMLANRFSQLSNQANLYRALGLTGLPGSLNCAQL